MLTNPVVRNPSSVLEAVEVFLHLVESGMRTLLFGKVRPRCMWARATPPRAPVLTGADTPPAACLAL